MNRNIATKYWDKRINLGVLGIVCVDAYLFFQQVVYPNNRTMSCLEFFGRLADKLIKNQEGVCATQAVVMDRAAAAIASIEALTMRRTLCQKERGGGTSCSAMVPLRQMQEADNLRVCAAHARTTWLGIPIFGSNSWYPHWKRNSNFVSDSGNSGWIFF
jgi:hypothetical protein